jgi:ATP-dependent DNA helicase DinG
MAHPAFAAARTRPTEAPAIAVGVDTAVWLLPAGEVERLPLVEAARRASAAPALYLCHSRFVARRLGLGTVAALDLLELYAFVRPARFVVPTVRGLASALLLDPPTTLEAEAPALLAIARTLLAELTASSPEETLPLARDMAAAGWSWGDAVLSALGDDKGNARKGTGEGYAVWRRLREWEETGAEAQAAAWPVEPVEARARLVQLLGAEVEPRPQQLAFATAAAHAFQPRQRRLEPHIVMVEAGTGVGKTLAYLAPALVWAQKNHGTVWISTFTRNLQRQIDRELDRAYPDYYTKAARVVVRKGRENIFCLLNFEEAVARRGLALGREAVAYGLIARWALATRDGDLLSGDFPAWLAGLFPVDLTRELTDSRGECLYAACRHYRRCFIERAIRRARRAEIVVANHALVLTRVARAGEDLGLPLRMVFDEAHHLFDAADNAYSLVLSGRETAELRRWLRGGEAGSGRTRRRGLAERLGDLISDDDMLLRAVAEAEQAARNLPGSGWRQRLSAAQPTGPVERFLALVREQVFARNIDIDHPYSLEAAPRPPIAGLLAQADTVEAALERLRQPLMTLARHLANRLDEESDRLDSASRQRIDGLRRSLERRALAAIAGWQAMLRSLDGATPPEFVDAFVVERNEQGETDVAFTRHFVDPTRPLAETVLKLTHGAVITSATLRDSSGDGEADWVSADRLTGVRHLAVEPARLALSSPFDYASLTRVFIVTDVERNDLRQVAAAYRELFKAAGGGGLGLFTAIGRLRVVHGLIAAPLEAAGIRLLAQHVDEIDTGTLIDIFRAEEESCLLGTDALRDGIDVPGRALRLIVFDRVPWPRPTLLHRARRAEFGGRRYEEQITRARLKQAFGRLIRRADDRGAFVILDPALPSRLTSAFPPGVHVQRLGLAAAIHGVRDHLWQKGS